MRGEPAAWLVRHVPRRLHLRKGSAPALSERTDREDCGFVDSSVTPDTARSSHLVGAFVPETDGR